MSHNIELEIFDDGSGFAVLVDGYTTTVLHIDSIRRQYSEYREILDVLVKQRDIDGLKALLIKMGLGDVNHTYR